MQRLTTQNLEHIGGSEGPKRIESEAYSGASSVASTRDRMPAYSTENNPAVKNWATYARANSKRPTEYTGYDAAGDAHRQFRAPSTTASVDDGSSRAPRDSNAGRGKASDTFVLHHVRGGSNVGCLASKPSICQAPKNAGSNSSSGYHEVCAGPSSGVFRSRI